MLKQFAWTSVITIEHIIIFILSHDLLTIGVQDESDLLIKQYTETRYFIVKSFNEDNVIKCMKDGIWTTQKQNGDVFREAFENCKNVILVFSINKSRAFQGYARMESLPGSVSPPPVSPLRLTFSNVLALQNSILSLTSSNGISC